MEKKKTMNRWQRARLLLGAALAAALLWGCLNTVSIPGTGGTSGTDQGDGQGTGAAEDFAFALRVGGAGSGAGNNGRNIVGPDPGGIRYGEILNVVQVIAVDDQGVAADFKQAVRPNDAATQDIIWIDSLWPGKRYHFLVLTGHRERDYAAEGALNPDDSYRYFDGTDSRPNRPPTLLAAGFAESVKITGDPGQIVYITMSPMIVDTAFTWTSGGVTVTKSPEASKTTLLPVDTAKTVSSIRWTLAWNFFKQLLDAQNHVTGEQKTGWGGLAFKDRQVILERENQASFSPIPALDSVITLPLGEPVSGEFGWAAFNVTYLPFGKASLEDFSAFDDAANPLTPWIIRNGVNDERQNEFTTFARVSGKIPWDGKANGNGAATFSFFNQAAVAKGWITAFSGEAGTDGDSAIDAILAAKAAGHTALLLGLVADLDETGNPIPEPADLTATATDIGKTKGLTLTTAANSPAAVILDGGGKTIPLSGNPGASVITVGNGVTLTLQNITFQGNTSNNNSLISVAAGGTLVLENGAVITGNKGTAANGGGVLVTGAGSKLVMKGGTISGTTSVDGSGVRVADSGVFEMSGGTISGNKTTNGGGVYLNGGAFTMSGNATISGNTANGNSSNGNGGGVYVASGTFTMDGGTIKSNITSSAGGGGVCVTSGNSKFFMNGGTISGHKSKSGVRVAGNGVFEMSGGTISDNTGPNGGVYVGSKFFMNGGEISGNAGGVYVDSGEFNMSGGTIRDNTSDNIGGVYVNGSTFTMSGNASISGNTNKTANGGGVYVNGGSSYFNMNGGTISGNTGGGDNEADGGVYVFGSTTATGTTNYATFIMTAGTISGNTGGAGVGIDNSGVFQMSGGTISGNGNVTAKYGGGVRLGSYFKTKDNTDHYQQATFEMTGGEITGNSALSAITPTTIEGNIVISGGGGGVWMSGVPGSKGGSVNTFTMSGDAVISGNKGGGVAVGLGAQFHMDDGTISGNTSDYGGGVFLFGTPTGTGYWAQFIKTGGTLYGKDENANTNAANTDTSGHAVYYQKGVKQGTGDYYLDDMADTGDKITVEAKQSAGKFEGLVGPK